MALCRILECNVIGGAGAGYEVTCGEVRAAAGGAH
jgi:hypothetical protein